ncbi:MAG: helix-turn-helix domain-containing protein [Chloroflexi bacterium]|nr:helix-turn-helix domain-containing protein [Chloroflexota bacterium]
MQVQLGRELRVARFRAGLTQKQVGRQVDRSASRISRIEGGLAPAASLTELMRVAAAIGMKLYVNAYPLGRRALDAPQLAMLTQFNSRLHPSWRCELEKVMPKEGDLRAIDELIWTDEISCAVEAITRLAEVQGHLRPARAKQRDIGATRLILLVKGSRANRRVLHEADDLVRRSFQVGTRRAFEALAAGRDPGGDCLILI